MSCKMAVGTTCNVSLFKYFFLTSWRRCYGNATTCRLNSALKTHCNTYAPFSLGMSTIVTNNSHNHFGSWDMSRKSSTLQRGCTQYYYNRNPRSLELLGLAEKPKGFKTRKWRVDYYHRLMLDISSRHVSAYVNHNNGKKVVEASTKEFCISRHLYKTCDVTAAYNIGRVLADRCQTTGLSRMIWEHKKNRQNKKVRAFIQAIYEGGVRLCEPKVKRTLPPPGVIP